LIFSITAGRDLRSSMAQVLSGPSAIKGKWRAAHLQDQAKLAL